MIPEMCGRFALAFAKGFFTRFEIIDQQASIEPRFNITPTQTVPTVTKDSPNHVAMMRWGLVPFWAKDPKIGNKLINARAEGITKRPAFRASVKRRRCLVPATGFYEWKKANGGKIPHYVRMKDDSFFWLRGTVRPMARPSRLGAPLIHNHYHHSERDDEEHTQPDASDPQTRGRRGVVGQGASFRRNADPNPAAVSLETHGRLSCVPSGE